MGNAFHLLKPRTSASAVNAPNDERVGADIIFLTLRMPLGLPWGNRVTMSWVNPVHNRTDRPPCLLLAISARLFWIFNRSSALRIPYWVRENLKLNGRSADKVL